TQKPRSRKAKASFHCRLISAEVEVGGHRYHVEPIPAGEDGSAAFRMVKCGSNDAVYDLVRTHAGIIECSCPDYEVRRRGLTCDPCRRGRPLRGLGRRDPPRPNFGPTGEPLPAEASPCTNCDPEASDPAGWEPMGTHGDPPARLMGPPVASLPFAERIDVE